MPLERPAGEPVIALVLEGRSLTALAKLNGKNRKMLETVAEHGAATVAVVLQGTLHPPAGQGSPFTLEGAGFQVNVKTPTPGSTLGRPNHRPDSGNGAV